MKIIINNGYIVATSETVGVDITEQEYNTILETIHNKPQAEQGFDYRLKEDLTWELVELPQEEADNG